MPKRAATLRRVLGSAGLISGRPHLGLELPLAPLLDRHQPVHFIGVGGIGMSALAEILAQRGFAVSGSDNRDNVVLDN